VTSIRWSNYLWGLTATAICTAAAFPIGTRVDLIDIVMVYMLGSTAAALWLGRGPSALTAVANVLAFNFFFVPPRFSLADYDHNYLVSYVVTLAVNLLVALIITRLVTTAREQTEAADARERHTAALLAATRDLALTLDLQSMADITVRRIAEELHCSALLLRCDECSRVNSTPFAASGTCRQHIDMFAAQWAASRRQRAGLGSRQFGSEQAIYLPLANGGETIGVLVAQPKPGSTFLPEQQRLLEGLASQLASALERARLTELAQAAHVAAESARIRTTLLASISHDLRTPLSVIASAGGIVAKRGFALDINRRVTLGKLIEEKARAMTDLLSNVLDLVKLESGADVLNRDWHILEDVVGLAIHRNRERLEGWEVKVDLPEDLPMVSLDATLFLQLLSNLLENAAKYTPTGTQVRISAVRRQAMLHLVVEDNGPGWGTQDPDQLFEKFSRARPESIAGGVGLGLTICRAIVRLHGGEIQATASGEGGARLEIEVPVAMENVRLEAAAAEA